MADEPPSRNHEFEEGLQEGVQDPAAHAGAVEGTPSTETRAEPSPPVSVPKRIGRYQIRRVIGTGGMGTVYEAVQERPRRSVALKVMRRGVASRSALRRFEHEAQLLARLRHPGIAHVYEAGMHEDVSGPVPYFAMEYIPNARPLTEYAQEKKLGTRERLRLFIPACEAVHHGHQKAIVHRDLKPGNILVDAHGQVKIIDFGVARSTDSDMAVTTLQTDIGELVGTLKYMSPEQFDVDPRDIDGRSDVYALGVVLYELLSGQLPYDVQSPTIFEAPRVIRDVRPRPLSAVDKTLRGDLETIVAKALEKDRDRRYPSALALAEDVQRYLNNEPITARPPTPAYRLSKFVQKRWVPLAVTAVLLLALVVAVSSQIKARHAERTADEKTARGLFFEAQMESHRNPARAVKKYEEAIAIVPGYLEAKIARAFLLRWVDRDGAVTAARAIIDEHPKQAAPAHLLLAQLFSTRDPDLAAHHLQEGSRTLPEDKYYRALALSGDRAQEAINMLTEVIEADPLDFNALWARSLRYHDVGNWEGMLADAERLTTRWPDTPMYWNAKGFALSKLRRTREALACYDRFLTHQPDYARVYVNRAEMHHSLGNMKEAVADCNRALEREPDFPTAYAMRGMVFADEEKLDLAWRDTARALELEPNDLIALRTSGFLHMGRGAFQTALEAYEKGIQEGKARARDYHNRGRLRRMFGQYELALADSEQALAMVPTAVDEPSFEAAIAHSGRGLTRRFLGDLDGAIEDFSRTVSADPTWGVQCNQWIWEIRMLRNGPGDREAAEEALAAAQKAGTSAFDHVIVEACRGRATENEVFAHGGADASERCAGYYYLGVRALVEGRAADAGTLFEQARETQAYDYPEYDLALWHLRQLDAG